jgi:type IV secretory pathway TraG/TraD family ATPase VirD4
MAGHGRQSSETTWKVKFSTAPQTADYLEHCLGRKSQYARSETLREGTATSEGRSEQGIPLMTSQDIKQLKDEDIIGFHRRLPPFRAKRMDWRLFPDLVQRQVIPAPHLAALPVLDGRFADIAGQRTEHFPNGYLDPDR